MKQIIALQQYTDKYVSLYEGEIRNISDTIANKLIEEDIVAEHSDSSGGGSGGGFPLEIMVVNFHVPLSGSEITSDKTYGEITDAAMKGNFILGCWHATNVWNGEEVLVSHDYSIIRVYTGTPAVDFNGGSIKLSMSNTSEKDNNIWQVKS